MLHFGDDTFLYRTSLELCEGDASAGIDAERQAIRREIFAVAGERPRVGARASDGARNPAESEGQWCVRNPDDLERVVNAIATLDPSRRDALVNRCGASLRQVTAKESEGLAMLVAALRVRHGESCCTVARHHCICHEQGVRQLEEVAVLGPAGARVRDGECCCEVAREHGVCSAAGELALQMIALEGVAGGRVRSGECPLKVAQQHGIWRHQPLRTMREMAVERRLAKFVVPKAAGTRLAM